MFRLSFRRFYQNLTKPVLIFMVMFFMLQCQTDTTEPLKDNNSLLKTSSYEVTLQETQVVAQNFWRIENENSKARVAKTYDVDKMTTFSGDDQKPLFYAYTYKNGGFIIISADKRTIPVLAFSSNGDSDWDRASEVNGLQLWLEMAKNEINDIKKDNLPPDRFVTIEWAKYLSSTSHTIERTTNDPPIGGCDNCDSYTYTLNSLFSDKDLSSSYLWGQDYLSSYYLPTHSSCVHCGKDWAGCGAVAFALVARYLNLNSGSFNYSIMPHRSDYGSLTYPHCNPTNNGEYELSFFMYSCNQVVNSINGFFGTCYAFTNPWDIPGALEYWGLSDGGDVSTTSMYSKVQSERAQNKPVIFLVPMS